MSSSRHDFWFLRMASGPALAALVWSLTGHGSGAALTADGRVTAAIAVWMASWWFLQPVELATTALLPLVLFPLTGIAMIKATASAYAHPVIFLFFGGLVLSEALRHAGLDRTIAQRVLSWTGTRERSLLAGLMGISAFLSMWISNTATTAMLLPITLGVADHVCEDRRERVAPSLLLGVAYAASIGGMATLIGTPPNAFLASYAEQHGLSDFDFAAWFAHTLPLVLLLLICCWWLLSHHPHKLDDHVAAPQQAIATPLNAHQKRVLVIFAVTATCWITRRMLARITIGGVQPFAAVSDAGIAVAAALVLLSARRGGGDRRRLLSWADLAALPWSVLFLFGGGLALSAALDRHGVASVIGETLTAGVHWPAPMLILLVTTTLVALTEFASNTATAVIFIPILAGIARSASLPVQQLVVPATLAASCAFMLPSATPPNALAFASGDVPFAHLVRNGFWMNLISAIAITLWVWLVWW